MGYNNQPNFWHLVFVSNAFVSNTAFDVPLHQSHSMAPAEIRDHKERIKSLLKERNAVLVAHYYTDDAIQSLAEETGGCVSEENIDIFGRTDETVEGNSIASNDDIINIVLG